MIIPYVSIIIPSYNRAATVGQTIDSILSQQCNFDIEIVIGDDCSTDNAREVLKEYQAKYPENIKLLFYEQNIGLGANWATCVRHCRGKYIANCDNDDYWHNPHKLQLQVDFLENHPEYGVCHTNYRTHNRSTGRIDECEAFIDDKADLQKAFFTGKYRICNATMLYRKDIIDNYLKLDDFIKYQFTLQDWNTWIILANYTKFHCLPVSTATFGIETESITRPQTYLQIEKRFKKEKECYMYLCKLFSESFPFDEKGYDSYVNHILLNQAYKKFDFKAALIYSKEIIRLGDNSKKVKLALNPVSFYIYSILKKIR